MTHIISMSPPAARPPAGSPGGSRAAAPGRPAPAAPI